MTQAGKQLARARLDCLCRIVTDGTHDSPKLQQSGIPFVKGKHISGGFVDLENCDHITKEDHEKAIQRSKPERGDILFSNIGSVGDAAFISIDKAFSIKNVALFKPDPDVVDSKYLYYVVLGPKFRGELFAKRSGVAQPFFSLEMLRSHEVEYHHDLTIQKKIASILSTYDDLIENNLRRIKILEKMAQALYREWFVKFRFPGHEKVRIVDSPLGKIPEGWEVKKLLELADVTYGFAFKSKQFNTEGNGKPVVRIRDVLAGVSDTYSPEEAGSKYIVENGDILVGMDGEFHMGFWVGGNAYLVQRVARFRSKVDIGRYHLFLALHEPIQHFNVTITGTTVAHLGHEHIKTIEIVWPKNEARVKVNRFLEPLLGQVLNLRLKNQTLRRTRDLLLPKLISGELDVSDLDIDVTEEAA